MINKSISNLTPSTYFIIAGEESADNHGAELMKSMLNQNPYIQFSGIGGRKMIGIGLNSIEDVEKMAVMGFLEVIRDLSFFFNFAKKGVDEIDNF